MAGLAQGIQEVEVKYKVDNEAALLSALRRHGVHLSEPSFQDDQAYAPSSWRYGMAKKGVPFARLRTQDGEHLFTVKRPVSNELACLEYQTVVADREQVHGALLAMGYSPTVRIEKMRRLGTWADVSVCLDVVKGIGTFIELEAVADADQSGVAVQAELDRRVRTLGVPLVRVEDTYDSLIYTAAASKKGR